MVPSLFKPLKFYCISSVDTMSITLSGDIDAGYRSEPEYMHRSKQRSKSTSNVSKTARTL